MNVRSCTHVSLSVIITTNIKNIKYCVLKVNIVMNVCCIWLQSKVINWINEIEIYTSLTTRLSGFYTVALLLFSPYSPDDKLTKLGFWVSIRCVLYTTRYKWRHLCEGTIELQLHLKFCNNFTRTYNKRLNR